MAIASADVLRVEILGCRFTAPHEYGSYLCDLAAGLMVGVIAETCGYAKIDIDQCAETPPLRCAFTIRLEESEGRLASPDISHSHMAKGSTVVAEGLPESVQSWRLTPRELQILRLIAQGLSDKTIAAMLRLSVRTVENHSARIREKLHIDSRTGLVRFAFRNRLANP